MKTIYVILKCKVPDLDIVEIDGHLHEFSGKEFPEIVESAEYHHVSEKGYDLSSGMEKPKKKPKGKKGGKK